MKAKAADGFFQVSLLLLVATGFAAVVSTGRLDRTTAAAAGAALVARALIIRGWLRIPLSNRTVRVLSIAYIGFYPLDFLYLSGSFLDATVRLVFFLAAIKLLTARTGRDFLYLGIIAFLELLSAAMLTSGPGILGFLVLFLLFAVAARTSYEIQESGGKAARRPPAGRVGLRLATHSVMLALGIAVIGGGLFFVVPRAAGAYLSRLPATGESVLGFAEEVVLGTPGRLTQNPAPVLRVRILEGPLVANLKWRGGALQNFDGVKWSNPASSGQFLESIHGQYRVARGTLWTAPWARWPRPPGVRIRYRVLRAPLDSDALFLAGSPETLEGDFSRIEVSDNDAISIPGGRWKALRYESSSLVATNRPPEMGQLYGPYPARIRQAYLQLPDLDPRIAQLAHWITDSQLAPYWRAAALEHYLRTEYGYTLDLPPERPADPLADFLFRRKKGHCEYFASAMAVMLRTLGIPSRLVNGFQSGVYNPVSGYYTIRAREAHAWVEAYVAGFGWMTFDPTPADPRAAPSPSRSWLYLDALETFWNDWVIQYDLGRQLALARVVQTEWYKAGYETIVAWDRSWDWAEEQWQRWRDQPRRELRLRALLWFVPLLAAAAIFWAWPRVQAWRAARRVVRGRGTRQDCALLYARALEIMKRRGLPREAWQTAEEFAATLQPPRCNAAAAALLHQITQAYYRARFGRDLQAGRRLPALLRSLELQR